MMQFWRCWTDLAVGSATAAAWPSSSLSERVATDWGMEIFDRTINRSTRGLTASFNEVARSGMYGYMVECFVQTLPGERKESVKK